MATKTAKAADTFTNDERQAMKDRARELKAADGDGLADVLAKIEEMPEPDRAMAKRIHEIVMSSAPELAPRTYYGMPAYAKNGKVLCFFQPKSKFKVRYSTFGFQPDANLDQGSMWPIGYALTELTPADEARISDLVRRAAS